jgi:phospholipid/cholesterol/gamma-HCH transport system substrate-binding protein
MQRNNVETLMGAVVLFVALGFAVFFHRAAGLSTPDGYEILAYFTTIDGVDVGSPVRISGVKVGRVSGFDLDPETYQAIVRMQINNGINIPNDTAAVVSSAGFLDSKFLSLEPGGSEEMIEDGGQIEYTQSPPGLEKLLGQVIFSMNKEKETAPANGAAE